MSYKNGIYVAFDGGGDKDITSGDIKFYIHALDIISVRE